MPITLPLRYIGEVRGETMYLNTYAAPAIIACITNACIGIYIFYKNPKKSQNRIFVLIILSVIAFSIGEIMLRFSNNSEEGLLWGRIGYIGVIFVPLTLLHLSFVFPRERTIFARNKYALFGLYLIGVVLLCMFNLIVSSPDVQLSRWGYRVSLNPRFYFIFIWLLITTIFGFFNFLYSYIQSKTVIERKQVKHVFYGVFIVIIFTFGTNTFPSLFGIMIFPMGSISLSIFAIFVGAAILKYNLFRFKSMVRPIIEEKKAGPKKYKLETNKSYIVQEKRGEQGYEIFTDQITHDIGGLCITKYPPQEIRDKCGLKATPILWFTFKQSDKETTVNPKKLDLELVPQIEDFIKKGKQTIVYIDCFDQIRLVRGIESTLKLIKDIKNICEENHSILLLSVNPKMFEEKQISILEKGFLEV